MKKSELKQLIKEEVLNVVYEVGEASGTKYDWKQVTKGDLNERGEKQVYFFVTNSKLRYLVTLKNEGKYIDVDFKASGSYNVTNRGEMFSVMATIVDIIKYALKNVNTESNIMGLKYQPGSKGEDGSQRDKLYAAYIKKAIPNAKIDQFSGYATVVTFK